MCVGALRGEWHTGARALARDEVMAMTQRKASRGKGPAGPSFFFWDKNRHHNRCSSARFTGEGANEQCYKVSHSGCQWNRVGGDSSFFALELRGPGAGIGSGAGFARAIKPSSGVAGQGHVWGIPTRRRPNLVR